MVWVCNAENNSRIVSIVIFVYLALLQIVGIILAIQTRKVKIKVLNDSKYIAALIYISSLVLIVLAIITFTLDSLINVSELIYCGCLLLATTAFLCLTFIPKVHKVPSSQLLVCDRLPLSHTVWWNAIDVQDLI